MRFGVAGPQQPGIVGARPHRQHFERIEALGYDSVWASHTSSGLKVGQRCRCADR